jgi:Fe-S cluster biogenesis protein NfuA
MRGDDRTLKEQAARMESLLGDLQSLPDPAVRALALAIVQGLMALYGEGLARLLAIVDERDAGPPGKRLLDAFAGDELIAHLLLLHDLHPLDLPARVGRALEEVRPYLRSHGGNVELLGVEEGVARLRLQGSCHGCPSSAITLKQAIEQALWQAAPDLVAIETEGVAEPPPRTPAPAEGATFVPLSTIHTLHNREGMAATPVCPLPARS